MVKINYSDLKFDHVVEFSADDTIFACARVNGNGHVRLFLIFDKGNGRIYTRNGCADSWELLQECDAEIIRQRVKEALNNYIPVYKINGSHS
jgi:hypothetical protein